MEKIEAEHKYIKDLFDDENLFEIPIKGLLLGKKRIWSGIFFLANKKNYQVFWDEIR